MPCPFLTRLSQNYVKSYAPVLLKMYGSQCPVVSRTINHMASSDEIKGNNIILYTCSFCSTRIFVTNLLGIWL